VVNRRVKINRMLLGEEEGIGKIRRKRNTNHPFQLGLESEGRRLRDLMQLRSCLKVFEKIFYKIFEIIISD